MESVVFHDGTKLSGSQLNEVQNRKADAIKDRFTDTRNPGVVEHKSPAQIVYTDGTTLGIFGVTAYDSTGERIYVAQNANPELPAIQGLLPDETGLLIQGGERLVPTQVYTLVIRYKSLLNPPTTHHVTSGEAYLTHQDDSYALYLRTEDSVLDGDVILAQVNCWEDGSVTVDESKRTVSTIPSVSIAGNVTSVENNTGSNGDYGTNVTFQDHINSVGTGQVTARNAHGLSAADLGIDLGAMADHQKLLHVDGIRSDNLASTVSAMYPYYKRESLTNAEVVYIQPLSSTLNEMAVVNGNSVTPADFQSVYSFSFADYVGEDYAGFYLFSYDINTRSIVRNGPFASETDSVMTQLKNTPTLFPICSLQWKYVTYDVTGDDVSDVGSWDIIPASFKDLRVFNNTSLENFRPNQAFAITQFAPVANDIAYLHNARLISASTAPVFAVSSRTLNLTVDGDTELSVTFQGMNPLTAENVLEQMREAFTRTDANGNVYMAAYPRLTEDNRISISAPLSLEIKAAASNDAAPFLGFSRASHNTEAPIDNLLKEMIYFGERNGLILFDYDNEENVTQITYYLGGGVKLRNLFNYKNGLITHVNEIVEAL